MRKYFITIVFSVLVCQSLPILMGAESGIWFQEDFRNYGAKPPACSDNIGIKIGNDPVWTQTAEINCQMKESGFIFKEFAPYAKAVAEAKNYDVLFKFRFQSDKEAHPSIRIRDIGGIGER